MRRARATVVVVRTVLVLGALLFGLVGCRPPAEKSLAGAAEGWNVLLLSVDTLRADRLGVYGYDRRQLSPEMDGLLSRGVLFERAHAPRAATWPSLASALTGLYPSGHGLVANGYEFDDDQVTLATLLRDAGYRTGAFLGNMCSANHRAWDAFACGGGNDAKVTRKAVDWVAGSEDDRPFLLWVHYFGAHPPYYNGGDLAAHELDPGYDGPLRPAKAALDRVMTEGLELAARDVEHLDAIYDAAVRGTDTHVGRLLQELESRSLLDRTLVLFFADHGEDLYQHNRYLYHACSVYQTSLHVPLGFVALGLLPAGTRVEETVELVDLLPTLVELLGLEAPVGLHGASLLPVLEDPSRRRRPRAAFSEYDLTRIRTVVKGDWKLIDNPDAITPICMPGAPEDLYPIARTELYDLARDPTEQENVAARHPEQVTELRALIERRFAGLEGQAQEQEISDELRKELEALGYITD